jgi:hypothetical protein
MTDLMIGSLTPNVGVVRGGARITVRGRNFTKFGGSCAVTFATQKGKEPVTCVGLLVHVLNDKVLEVTAPDLSAIQKVHEDEKNWAMVSVSSGGKKSNRRLRFRYEPKCSIVRKCIKVEGHPGRCCADPSPPMYGQLDTPETSGGKIGTALIGYRLKDKHKKNSLPGPRPPPAKPPVPGGVIARTPRKCATGPIGGIDDARLREAKISTCPIVILPGFGSDVPGGKIGTALLGYRTKDKHKKNSLPGPRPPPEKPPVPGGVIAKTPRKCAVSVIGGIGEAQLREAKISTAPILMLPAFGANLPGGTFNMAGSKVSPISKSQDSPSLGYAVKGCGDRVLPGGKFNQSGSRKKTGRVTYLDML